MQGNAARAYRYTDAEVRGLGLDEVIDFPERLQAVSGQNVHDATWQYLDPDRCAMGILRGESPASGEPACAP
jgi:predicted Zn-dependent peptidase